MKLFLVMLILWEFSKPAFLVAAVDTETSTAVSTFSRSTTVSKSTQTAYAIHNDGTSKNSGIIQYDHRPGHEIFEDADEDGVFGEDEDAGIDDDGDGRLGESESQTGLETVSQKQRITMLNNMGFGKSLSTFKASGQIQRSSPFTNEPKEKTSEGASDFLQPDDHVKTSTKTETFIDTKTEKSKVLVA